MTLHKLSAGSGYEYLTRQVAALDSTERGATTLADYYAAKGEAPGRWVGSGLVGIDGIGAGAVVTAEQMQHLFGAGADPVTGRPLGSPYRVYGREGIDGFNVEVVRRIEQLNAVAGRPAKSPTPPAEAARVRSEVAREWFAREHGREPATARELSAALARYSRPRQTTVAGYDLTFSPVKSVSALWAVAPPHVAKLIERAHEAAVADVLAYLEREALFTREGADGARQVETRGLVATAFVHRDSRAGDPDLHTHVAVANKVQTKQGGRWLSVYGRVLHQHVVAASETYNTALEHHLHALLGVRFAPRPGAARDKRPVREIVGVDAALCERWSSRRRDIVARQRQLAAEFTRAQGRPPTPVEAVALAQQANLETRQAKHEPRAEADQRVTWRAEAAQTLRSPGAVEQMIAAALHPTVPEPAPVSTGWVRQAARAALAELEAHRATWQSWHVHAEAQRQVRDVAVPPGRVSEVVAWVVDAAEQLCVNLTHDRDPVTEPSALRRTDGTSVYRHTGADHFTSARILQAEQRLVAAAGLDGACAVQPDEVEIAIAACAVDGIRLNRGQRDLVLAMASSHRRVRLALAPAGTGKTTAMRVLARVWAEHGHAAVGMAPSAAAAAVLAESTGMACETLAKLDHQITHDVVHEPGHGDGARFAGRIGPGTLVVIDEAGMADTPTLDRVVEHCLAAGATVRLIGDDRQLAAVGAGGVLRDIAHQHGADRLDEVVRFTDPAEAAASLDLREGDPAALGFYLDHDRVHVGDTDTCLQAVLDAWSAETAAGRDCLMLAPTRELVAQLNAHARTTRLADTTPGSEVALRDGNHASTGDLVVTRHNDRRLGISGTDWVKNGDRWIVTAVVDGGALTVRHTASGLTTTLPADYVTAHVDLGYACTVHTAQGVTADTVHGILTGQECRQLLYTMLTRGRDENHAHLLLASPDDPDQLPLPGLGDQLTATETLEGILARDDATVSATTTAVEAGRPEAQLHQSVARYTDAVALAAQRILGSGWQDELDGAAQTVPLPWLPGIPSDLAAHETWGPYLGARARRVRSLADQVRARASDTRRTGWAQRYADILDRSLRVDLAVWRAGTGIPDHDRRLAGPAPDDPAGAAYHRHLVTRINRRYSEVVRAWEDKVVDYVGHRDEQTLRLAQHLDRLQRDGHNAAQLVAHAAARKPLPDDHAAAALAYRIQRQLRPTRRTTQPPAPRRVESPSQTPSLGV
ncbi:MAG TPA: MobF family relaxase [Nocardioidaceae bacterium]|jgi:conjugative relaxase-like TrwC/TraI family protein|nr:MobF family relaxase [Nocardioidaceae bacterium]